MRVVHYTVNLTCDICAVQISAQEGESAPYEWRRITMSRLGVRATGDVTIDTCSDSCARLALIQTANKVLS